MKAESSKRWLEAGIALANDPTVSVSCPECQNDILQVIDAPMGEGHVERWLFCPSCNARNMILMTLKNPDQK